MGLCLFYVTASAWRRRNPAVLTAGLTLLCGVWCHAQEAVPRELELGRAVHAFEHLGSIGHQAEAAGASGATIIYASGLGGDGYSGLPDADGLIQRRATEAAYVSKARASGVRVVLGYLCATSIVKLDGFDKNWSEELRARFNTSPSEWRQQDRDGKVLTSWYGGDYEPACMTHPDWRAYEKFMIRQQLEAGHDGIFFDNPTVHPKGCYCPHCMRKFGVFLQSEEVTVTDFSLAGLRELAVGRPKDFQRFRSLTARDFLSEMRDYAGSVRKEALITANNSLNSAGALYSQCRTYGYNIFEMSRAEDFVVVEDMGSQPRVLPDGRTVEYGPTYKQLHAISHGKPVVAVTVSDNDYHTPPSLVRLAMAEATAHDASYIVWTTWPEAERERMIAATRKQADFLRENSRLVTGSQPRRDVALFLPFRRWTETNVCTASALAAALSKANLQYEVFCEEDFNLSRIDPARALVVESLSVLMPEEKATAARFVAAGGKLVIADQRGWLDEVHEALKAPPSVSIRTVRAVVRDQPRRTVVHLLNLNIRRVSSFEDEVVPATELAVNVWVPFDTVGSVRLISPDTVPPVDGFSSTADPDREGSLVRVTVPRLEVAAMLIIEP